MSECIVACLLLLLQLLQFLMGMLGKGPHNALKRSLLAPQPGDQGPSMVKMARPSSLATSSAQVFSVCRQYTELCFDDISSRIHNSIEVCEICVFLLQLSDASISIEDVTDFSDDSVMMLPPTYVDVDNLLSVGCVQSFLLLPCLHKKIIQADVHRSSNSVL